MSTSSNSQTDTEINCIDMLDPNKHKKGSQSGVARDRRADRGRARGRARGRGRQRGAVSHQRYISKEHAMASFHDRAERVRHANAKRLAYALALQELMLKRDTLEDLLLAQRYLINNRTGLPESGITVPLSALRQHASLADGDAKSRRSKYDDELVVTLHGNNFMAEADADRAGKQAAASVKRSDKEQADTAAEQPPDKPAVKVYRFSREQFYHTRAFQDDLRSSLGTFLRVDDEYEYPIHVFTPRNSTCAMIRIGFERKIEHASTEANKCA